MKQVVLGSICLVAVVSCGEVASSTPDAAVVSDSGHVTLTVTVDGTGAGTVTSSPAGIDCGATCSAQFDTGSSVTLTAVAAAGTTFVGWSNGCDGTAPTCTLTMSQALTATATFASARHTLTVVTAGLGSGGVMSAPAGINCPTDCDEAFGAGSSVTLTAAPTAGSVFTGWSGACSGTQLTCSVPMTDSKAVTATFQPAFCTTGMLDRFDGADGTTIAGWTERAGDWQITTNRVHHASTGGVYTHYMTKDGSSQTDGCASVAAFAMTPAGAGTVEAVGVVLRWTSPNNYVVGLVQDNNSDGTFDNMFIYEYPGGTHLGALGGLALGTTPRIKACIVGNAVTLSADAANDGVFEVSTTATTTLAGAGLAGVMIHTFSTQPRADDFCVGE